MAATARKAVAKVPAWRLALQRWAYSISYFPQLGMMRDDCLRGDCPIVKEAVTRLPKDIHDGRVFRITRGLYLSGNKKILPKDEWMTLDKDVPYLQKYIAEVKAEKADRQDWLNKY